MSEPAPGASLVPPGTIDNSTLRARLAAPGVGVPAGSDDVAGLGLAALTPAAVLVAFLQGAAPGVLLTKRNAHLSTHAGQVSFPGGRIESGDASPEVAALREAEEEIGLAPGRVELLGRLGDYVTGTGYRITPVLGVLPAGVEMAGLELAPSVDEVDSVFVLPLSVLLDPAAPRRRRMFYRERMREFWVWPHSEHYIWGATAGILVQLAGLLRGE
jgi:8-oxo-dGTP pyrophosphatase MutT (NUDIX family)